MDRKKGVEKIPIFRIIHEQWSTEEMIASWYEAHEGICLRCRLTIETVDHIYQCRSEQARQVMETAIQMLRRKLTKCKTVPMITDLIVSILKEHRQRYQIQPTINAYYSDQIKRMAKLVYQKQRQIGPRLLTKGLLVYEWESLQNICERNTNTSESNIERASRVIDAIWDFSKMIWDGRCKQIHDTNPATNKSLKTTELLRILNTEIQNLR